MPTTWAVAFTRPDHVALQRVETPEPGPGQVLVRTRWSWISNGTEGSFLRGERHDGETPATAQLPAPYPIVPGYQRVGEVVAADPATRFAVGQSVFVSVSRVDGLAQSTGGHLHCAPADAAQVWALPDSPAPEAFSGLVLTQVGYNCGQRPAGVGPGDCAVVVGDGLVGHWAAQTLAGRGLEVLMLGRHPARLARWPGASAAVPSGADPAAAVREWSGRPVQVVVDTVGSVATLTALFPSLARDGHLVSAGFNRGGGLIDIQLLRRREATLHCPSGWTRARMDETLAEVAAGRLVTLPLVTDRLPASQVAAAWHRIETARATTLGVLLDWSEVED